MPDYRFLFIGENGSASPPTTSDAPTDLPTDIPVDTSGGGGAAGGAINRIEKYAASQVLTPLNSATGGLAMPSYRLGRSIVSGASAGAIAGGVVGLVIAAGQLVINKIKEASDKHKTEAAALNERDNVLLRAGAKTGATFYSGNVFGVKSTDRS